MNILYLLIISVLIANSVSGAEPGEMYMGLCDGYVTDSSGAPIQNAIITVTVDDKTGGGSTGTATTDANGYYVVYDLDIYKDKSVTVNVEYNHITDTKKGVARIGGVVHVNFVINITQDITKTIEYETIESQANNNKTEDTTEDNTVTEITNNKTENIKVYDSDADEITNATNFAEDKTKTKEEPNISVGEPETKIIGEDKQQSKNTKVDGGFPWMSIGIIIFIIFILIILIKKQT